MTVKGEYVRHRVYVDVLSGDMWIAEDAAGELYFPVRPSCAALDLDSTTALETIKRDSRLAPGLRKLRLPTESRGDHEQQCLASTEYAWWLALMDPRRFKPERRAILEDRQRVLMRLAKEIMMQRGSMPRIAPVRPAQAAETRGALEAHFRCIKCGAPHIATIDGAGWHLHLGVEVEP